MLKMAKNKRLLTAVLVKVFMGILAAAASVALLTGGLQGESSSGPVEELPGDDILPGDDVIIGPDDELEGDIINQPVSYNKPSEMRAVYLTPGVDFLTGSDTSSAKVKSQIDSALATAKGYGMNTVIINTTMKGKVLYKTDLLPTAVEAGFDPLEYAITAARGQGLYVYAIFDALLYYEGGKLVTPAFVDNNMISAVVNNAKALAENYKPDGILLSGYYNENTDSSYAAYLKAGGAVGYENYMRSLPQTLVANVSKIIHRQVPGVQVGLLADAVWQNKAADANGSDTNAGFTALSGGNADTKGFIEQGLFDFVAVKSYGSLTDNAAPFAKVVSWWAGLANSQEIPLYVVQASDRICTGNPGWAEGDQIVKQIIEARKISGFNGSIFNHLPRLIENPSGARELLLKYLNNEIKPEYILTQLTFSKPTKTSFTTYEPTVTFTGASDPAEPVLLGDEKITTDTNGFFTIMLDLKPGKNEFVFKHKGKTITFTVDRLVKVLKEVSPAGSVSVDGGMKITITALAYEGSKVTATLGGQSINLSPTETEGDATDKESTYKLYTGEYTAPAGGSSVQSLGSIKVNASWQGVSESATGASVNVNKKVNIGSGSPVQVIATEAETFPTSTLSDLSDGNYYPLPKGAQDYTVGDEIIYKEGSTTYRYYNLASGVRVYSKDISSISSGPSNNAIKGMVVQADNSHTYVKLNMTAKVSYILKYSPSQITLDFQNTKSAAGNISNLTKNPLFSSATWSGTTLTLKLRNSGGFLGYSASYNGTELVLRFNNPPTGGGVRGARILVDAGHGGSDPGALGFNPSYPEAYINAQIAEKLASRLSAMGATVFRSGNGMSLDARVNAGISNNASMLVAVHSNSAASTSAKGAEAYYFYGYSSRLSSNVSSAIASAMGNGNRGSKYGRYRVTRSSQFAATLMECGFVSTASEYNQLMNSSYQQSIADNVASAIASFYSSAGSGTVMTGTQSVGETSIINVTGVTLDATDVSLAVGATKKLVATVAPADAADKSVTWKSSNENVATVAADGTVTAKAVGTANITVTTTDGGKTAAAKITVTSGVTGVTLDKTTLALTVNATGQLTATVAPATATNKNVTWASSNTAIATVDTNGLVTAKAVGSATITVTTADGGKTATCAVTVTEANVPVQSLSLSPASANVDLSSAGVQLTPTFTPDNATNKNVTWQSSNTGVATVSATGFVTPVAAGSATITATTADGGKTATCVVTVTDTSSIAVTGINLSPPTLTLAEGDTGQLTANVLPANATNRAVNWSSSDPAIATVDSNGQVSAVTAGSVTITATTADGGKTSSCQVTVTAAETSS